MTFASPRQRFETAPHAIVALNGRRGVQDGQLALSVIVYGDDAHAKEQLNCYGEGVEAATEVGNGGGDVDGVKTGHTPNLDPRNDTYRPRWAVGLQTAYVGAALLYFHTCLVILYNVLHRGSGERFRSPTNGGALLSLSCARHAVRVCT